MSQAKSFSKIEDHARTAFQGYVAVWQDEPGRETAIMAPTLEQLSLMWLRITGQELIEEWVQSCRIIMVSP